MSPNTNATWGYVGVILGRHWGNIRVILGTVSTRSNSNHIYDIAGLSLPFFLARFGV